MSALLKLAAEARRKGCNFYATRSRFKPYHSVYGAGRPSTERPEGNT